MATVLMFGVLREVAGWRERRIEAASLSALRAILRDEDPALADRLAPPGTFAVVNAEVALSDRALSPGDEVAFVPPVSGG